MYEKNEELKEELETKLEQYSYQRKGKFHPKKWEREKGKWKKEKKGKGGKGKGGNEKKRKGKEREHFPSPFSNDYQ